jgi:uncharacterized protein with von Willebrand factor type A (vWA) domain
MSIPCSYNSDVERFVEFYEDCIDKKVLKYYKKFDKTKENIYELVDESKELEEV